MRLTPSKYRLTPSKQTSDLRYGTLLPKENLNCGGQDEDRQRYLMAGQVDTTFVANSGRWPRQMLKDGHNFPSFPQRMNTGAGSMTTCSQSCDRQETAFQFPTAIPSISGTVRDGGCDQQRTQSYLSGMSTSHQPQNMVEALVTPPSVLEDGKLVPSVHCGNPPVETTELGPTMNLPFQHQDATTRVTIGLSLGSANPAQVMNHANLLSSGNTSANHHLNLPTNSHLCSESKSCDGTVVTPDAVEYMPPHTNLLTGHHAPLTTSSTGHHPPHTTSLMGHHAPCTTSSMGHHAPHCQAPPHHQMSKPNDEEPPPVFTRMHRTGDYGQQTSSCHHQSTTTASQTGSNKRDDSDNRVRQLSDSTNTVSEIAHRDNQPVTVSDLSPHSEGMAGVSCESLETVRVDMSTQTLNYECKASQTELDDLTCGGAGFGLATNGGDAKLEGSANSAILGSDLQVPLHQSGDIIIEQRPSCKERSEVQRSWTSANNLPLPLGDRDMGDSHGYHHVLTSTAIHPTRPTAITKAPEAHEEKYSASLMSGKGGDIEDDDGLVVSAILNTHHTDSDDQKEVVGSESENESCHVIR